MASYSSLATTASLIGNGCAKVPNLPLISPLPTRDRVSFPLPAETPKLSFLPQGLLPGRHCSALVRAQLNEVSPDGSSNASASSQTKSLVASAEVKDPKPATSALATEESISEFIGQVSRLVKLVDSQDIVELQLKQLDCELLIRKKEALPQPPPPSAPAIVMHAPPPPLIMPAAAHSPSQTAAPVPSAPTPSHSPAAKLAKSSLPPLKCPMAGTFYRSPGPSEPPFVKVGDKVQKGQVLCIIEAMKLMNEIEADQSGTIVEILAEDGKPVSVDTENQHLIGYQRDQMKGIVDNLIGRTRLVESKIRDAKTKKDALKARTISAKIRSLILAIVKTATALRDMMENVNGRSALLAFGRMEEKVMMLEFEAESTNQMIKDDLDEKFSELEGPSFNEELENLKKEMSNNCKRQVQQASHFVSPNLKSNWLAETRGIQKAYLRSSSSSSSSVSQ